MRHFIFILFALSLGAIHAQNASEVYGKNKVQYNHDQHDWWIYETNNFVFYWYSRSRNEAQFCIEIAETLNTNTQSLFEYHLEDKIEVIVYADHSDAMQSNLATLENINAREWDVEPKVNNQTIRIYFDGSHNDFANELHKAIIKVYFNSMFAGSSFQQVVQKIISYRLPEWFEIGLIDYLSSSWTTLDLCQLNATWNQRTAFKNYAKKNVNLAGRSFWNFISKNYGPQSISNFLYLSRINKDINKASKIVFQTEFANLSNLWSDYYKSELSRISDPEVAIASKIKLKKNEYINQILKSKLGDEFIITTNQLSKSRVRKFDLNNNKLKTIFRSGYQTKFIKQDRYYPLYVENINRRESAIIYGRKNRIYIKLSDHNNASTTVIIPEEIKQIYDAEWLSNDVLVLSALGSNFVDIYYFNLKTRSLRKFTNDIYDDLQLGVDERGQLLFSSNRNPNYPGLNKLDSIFPTGNSNIFIYDRNAVDDSIHLFKPINTGDVTDFDIRNNTKYIINYKQLSEEKSEFQTKENNKIVVNINKNNFYRFDSNQIIHFYKNNSNKYVYSNQINTDIPFWDEKKSLQIVDTAGQIDAPIISAEKFYSRFGSAKNFKEVLRAFYNADIKVNHKKQWKENSEELHFNDNHRYNSTLAIAYRERFKLDEFSYDINNSILFDGLNTYSGLNSNFQAPRSGLLVKAKVKENFENYWIEFGIRVPFNFKGSEAYLLFQNNKKLLDHQFAIYRKYSKEPVAFDLQLANNTLLFNYILKYPFDHYKSLRLNSTWRNDHSFLLLSKKSVLDTAGYYQQRIGSRLEYVFDNLINHSLNINEGWQFKMYAEGSKRLSIRDDLKASNLSNGMLFLIGTDARYHKIILKKSSWSSRIFAVSSFGSERILYHTGATENWLFPQYNNQSRPSKNLNYAYQSLATEVRGHYIGARKGSSALVMSTELRIPFLQYILSTTWKNSFFRNLQLIGFLDYGLTWNGIIPNWKGLSTQTFHGENPVVKIDLNYKINPFIAGNGIGIRSALFGYFLRMDYAYKLDETGWHDPVFHISLGLDF